MKLQDHPTVQSVSRESVAPVAAVDPAWLREVCREAGADDVGFVSIERAELSDERPYAERALPGTKTLVSMAFRMNRGPIRSPERSISNLEFHHTGDHANETCRKVTAALEARGFRALNPAMGFPMEADRWGQDRIWVISHKTVAVAAGLGVMGIHRNVIHPRLGSFILLGTVLVAADLAEESRPLDFNPCLECKLCVAACPTGAIHTDGGFDFAACYTHNYREFMGGFAGWVEAIADSGSAHSYRERVTDAETVSMWQSLAFGPNYKAAFCLSVCPAGEEVIRPFLEDRKQFLDEVVRPLQDKPENIYVVAGSDAEAHVRKRFPHKRIRRVPSALRAGSIRGFLGAMPSIFQRLPAKGLNAVYHFRFVGDEPAEATVTIRDQRIAVRHGLHGRADLTVTADSRSWLRFLDGRQHIVWALLRRKIRLQGPPRLFIHFGRCFPR